VRSFQRSSVLIAVIKCPRPSSKHLERAKLDQTIANEYTVALLNKNSSRAPSAATFVSSFASRHTISASETDEVIASLSAKGLPGVTRNYPHTPGIDAAGVIVESSDDGFSAGDKAIFIGYALGMNTAGGYGEYIRVPANWAVKMPEGLNAREAMVIGTTGFTAALCVDKIEQMGAQPADGPVVVTGATGGVGSVAVALLAKLGYEVVASSGKADKGDYLKSLGATSVISRAELSAENKRPMAAETWAHGVDTVGGEILSNVIKGLKYSGSVAICGLGASLAFSTTVLPFILRNVNILGIDSVVLPLAVRRQTLWNHLTLSLSDTFLPVTSPV